MNLKTKNQVFFMKMKNLEEKEILHYFLHDKLSKMHENRSKNQSVAESEAEHQIVISPPSFHNQSNIKQKENFEHKE